MTDQFTDAQRLKFRLLAEGARITPRAAEVLHEVAPGEWTPADYASTSGIIVRLDRSVWVNIPVEAHNPNFVGAASPYVFDHADDGFFVHGDGLAASAEFWPPPAYHGTADTSGRPLNNYVYSHGDRVRLSPIIGCSMNCEFCNIPFDDTYAGVKPVEAMLTAVRTALADPVQRAHHMLISGGTPGPPHVAKLRKVYETVLETFPSLKVDIMMVPVPGVFDLPTLKKLGVHQLSINIEVFNQDIAAKIMRHKHRQGRQHYLDFIGHSSDYLGSGSVRSMLMVGLEPLEDTIRGVRAVAESGGTPVLSPFRPDPVTPLARRTPPSALELERAYLAAIDTAASCGTSLGPDCGPCTHNTLAFLEPGSECDHSHGTPVLIGGA